MSSAQMKSETCAPAAEVIAPARDVISVASALPVPRGPGRPKVYDEETGVRICEMFAEGKSTEEIFAADAMPSRSTFFRWVAEEPELERIYRYALHARAEGYAEEYLKITRDWSRLYITQASEQTKDTEQPVLLKLVDKNALGALDRQIDALKFRMAKDNPRKYAELPAVAVVEAPAGQGNGDGARVVGQSGQVIDHHPLAASIAAWRKGGVTTG